MTSRAAATRYARALFDVVRNGNPEGAGDEVNAFAALIAGHPDLQRTLTSPAVPASAKAKVVDALLRQQPLSQPVTRLLLMLAERDRLALVPDIVEAYRQRLLDHQQVVQAQVTTAVPLPVDRTAALEQSLAQATGKRVIVSTQVDPSIIGGIVARIGSRVYDGSVINHLARVKAQLVDAAQ
jgi:F-type H+-transporting ATPase subunit delta